MLIGIRIDQVKQIVDKPEHGEVDLVGLWIFCGLNFDLVQNRIYTTESWACKKKGWSKGRIC